MFSLYFLTMPCYHGFEIRTQTVEFQQPQTNSDILWQINKDLNILVGEETRMLKDDGTCLKLNVHSYSAYRYSTITALRSVLISTKHPVIFRRSSGHCIVTNWKLNGAYRMHSHTFAHTRRKLNLLFVPWDMQSCLYKMPFILYIYSTRVYFFNLIPRCYRQPSKAKFCSDVSDIQLIQRVSA
jgi:hypothetical protein